MLETHRLTARQQAIIDMTAPLARRFAERVDRYDRAGMFPQENYRELHEAGYLRLVIPPEYGGEGANVYDMVLAQECLGRGDGATAMATGMLVQLLGRLAEDRTWPEAVFADVCRSIASHGGLINSVVTEPELGSISRGGTPGTHARPVDGGWLVSGHKIFVSGAPALRYLVVGVALPASEAAPKGLTANAIIQYESPGLRYESTWSDSLSLRSCANDDLYLEDVFVPDAWMVDRRPIGVAAAPTQRPGMNAWGLTIAAGYLGVGQAACDAACDYANNRVPPSLGKPIAELPHIQNWIGSMQIALAAARAVLHDTAQAWAEQPDRRVALSANVAAAKYLATNAACTASETALRVAGGFSLTRNLPLERLFRDARAGLFHPPQDDLALAVISRAATEARRASHANGGDM
jgi:alkylation response protein AidB-like acyl-CoA dehydrogenase